MKLLLTSILITILSTAWSQFHRRFEEPIEMPPDLFSIKSFPSETPPKYPGTKEEMLYFIEIHFHFAPEMAIEELYKLEALIQVDVSKTGEILNIHDLKNRQELIMDFGDQNSKKDPDVLFEELKRIFLLMPNWIPGKTQGKNVKASTVVEYKKPIVYAYGNEFMSDTLVYDESQQLDITHIYTNPQIKPKQRFDSLEYTYLMSLKFNYPEELLKDSIICAYTYECLIDEYGNARDCKLATPSVYPLMDSISFEHMKHLPMYEPASIDGVAVKCTLRVGHFVYPPDYIKEGRHGMRENRQRGRYYQTSEQGLRRHFEENFNYPEALREKPIFGTVYLSLEALEDGSLKFCYVLSGINPLIDIKVVAALKQSSDWTYVNYDRPYVKGQSIIVAIRISERHLE